jgi:hypothetical protein
MIDPDGLLMIEPLGPREAPIEDRYTELARAAWAERVEGLRFRGAHCCACGAWSDNCAWRVRGLLTNSLLVHYVREHRSEVPAAELEKLERFVHPVQP